MGNYSKIFADYKMSSFQDQAVKASGELNWFLPTESDDFPRLLLVNNGEILVKYNSKYQLLDGKNIQREAECNLGYNIILNSESILYADQMEIELFDIKKNDVTQHFNIPDINAESIIKNIYQFNDKCFIEMVNRAKEESSLVFPKTDDDVVDLKEDKTIFIVINSSQQIIWRKVFDNENITSLILEDLQQAVVFHNEDPFSNSFSIIDLNTGNEINKIKVEKASFLNASLDFNNNINALLHSENNEVILRNYSLNGKINWEYILPVTSIDYVNQPPAVNNLNQVYCLINNNIYAIDNGKLLWNISLPEDEYFKFITITAENNILTGSSFVLSYIDSNGKPIFNYILSPHERITTPPVIDKNGLIYFGSTKGIYSIK